ncbi:MAG TPA: hypothetical protein GX692_00670, partial [Acholeplasmataceae bacterium]|nr:hypothetical protein [Acholeplasmataceae bacterium]
VSIEEFQAEITSGTGIEVSLDGLYFSSYISTSEIVERIKDKNFSGGSIVLDAVTTATGYNQFKVLVIPDEEDLEPEEEVVPKLRDVEGEKWISFELYFRTPYQSDTQQTWVYMLTESYITSEGFEWISDAAFDDAMYDDGGTSEVHKLKVGDTKEIFACNSLRMSFLTHQIDTAGIGELDPIGEATETVVIYELDPDIEPENPWEGNNRLDSELKPYGSIDYYRVKSGVSDYNLLEIFSDEEGQLLPEVVLKSSHLVEKSALSGDMTDKYAIVKLETPDANQRYYYGVVKVQMWIEGWDPDCYNAIMAADLKIGLSFGGSNVAPNTNPQG